MNSTNTAITSLKALIFTDLDGSLLDHFTYNTEPANRLMIELEHNKTPVIFCTSKTFSEVCAIRQQLNNHHPFIVENGAAIFIPKGYFPEHIENIFQSSHDPDYLQYSFCKAREYWLKTLEQIKPRYLGQFAHFHQMGAKAIVRATGLPLAGAMMANNRQFSEPIQWLGDTEIKKHFIDEMHRMGANIEEGGRFLHLSGHCNKGKALLFLFEQYQQQQDDPILSIALGDGKNDIPMLDAAEHAVLIRSPVHPFPPINKEKLIKTDHYGPHGWVEGIQKTFQINLITS
tara:strand:- start:18421 stop:19281 length:861 start_codon:yes stop_codon:yes gene_type:complete